MVLLEQVLGEAWKALQEVLPVQQPVKLQQAAKVMLLEPWLVGPLGELLEKVWKALPEVLLVQQPAVLQQVAKVMLLEPWLVGQLGALLEKVWKMNQEVLLEQVLGEAWKALPEVLPVQQPVKLQQVAKVILLEPLPEGLLMVFLVGWVAHRQQYQARLLKEGALVKPPKKRWVGVVSPLLGQRHTIPKRNIPGLR